MTSRTSRWPSLLTVASLLALLLAAMLATTGRTAEYKSDFVSAEALRAHGVDLAPVPLSAAIAEIDADQARAIAIGIVKMPTGPRETHHVFARPTADAAPRGSWLLLFEGGEHGGSIGPPAGADTRAFATEYTGVLIDDQTGELLYWFQGGSFAP